MTSLAYRGGGLSLALLLAACAPTLNWRDVRPEGSGVQLQFPCKPTAQQRRLPLAGRPVDLALLACSTGDLTWGLAHADVGDPAQLGPALEALVAAAAGNLAAAALKTSPAQIAGATPHPASVRTRLQGRLPDGKALQMDLVVFVHGTRVFQASVLGERLADDAVDTFVSSIRFAR